MKLYPNKTLAAGKKFLVCLSLIVINLQALAQIPLLNSRPTTSNQVIYLDFDGHVATGTSWNSGNTINALPSTMNANNIISIWKRVMEDFIPFDVNVTTDSTRFNLAAANKRMRVVITPTSAWYGSAGGVAYLYSFTWGGTPGTPCWVFENQLGNNPKYIAEAASHEAGHTLSLRHQSTYSLTPTCTKTAEYNPGQGTGVTGWAPIMGVGYYKNVTTWFNGTSALNCNTIQYDHGSTLPGITSSSYLSFFPDDVGDTYNTGKTINLNVTAMVDSGLISTPTDVDVYRFSVCNNRYISINVRPWAFDTVSFDAANLDISLKVWNAATNSVIASSAPINKLNALVGVSLTPGSYYFTVDGDGSANYSDYGSLGRYYIYISTTNAPLFTNTIVTSSVICQGKATTLSYTSNGAPNIFNWQVAGPMTTSSTAQYPSVTFSVAGTHTITMLGVTSAFVTCPVTKTIVVQPSPSFSLSSSNLVCKDANAILVASPGVTNTYTWMPGNLVGATHTLVPPQTTNYTVTASNGVCTKTAVTTLSVSPDFTLQVFASDTSLCFGDTLSLTASGANSYTFMPGGVVASQLSVTPFSSVVYTVYAVNQDNCLKQDTVAVFVKMCETVGLGDNLSSAELRVYPNPVDDQLVIQGLQNEQRVHRIQITNGLGQVVLRAVVEPGSEKIAVDVSSLANGIYLLKVEGAEQVVLRKLAVER